MLTVIIYKKSSQEFIDKYRGLFEIYRDKGDIAFCFWDEHGTDISSALPQLTSIVGGERKWKAIVALPMEELNSESDIETDIFDVKKDNPFDYICNAEAEPPVHESKIPLIRLAQMLGGVPLVNRHYENRMMEETDFEEDGKGKKIYKKRLKVERKESEAYLDDQQILWDEINNKYSFTCEKPTYLYLFAAREPREIEIPVVTDIEVMNRHENDSSLFWYRNRYPAKARFLVQDCSKNENAYFYEDRFSFWMTVLVLALNDFPTGTLEAYKLYNVRSVVDLEKLHRLFSDYYNRLDGAKLSASRQIIELKKSVQFTGELEELPFYHIDIPVDLKEIKGKDLYISGKDIGLSGNCPVEEEPWFRQEVRQKNQMLEKIYRSTRRILDRASFSARLSAKVLDEEIHDLDEYQFEEMKEELSEMEREILITGSSSVLPLKVYTDALDRAEKSAVTSMKKRMYRKKTILACGFALAVYLAGFLPDIVYQMIDGNALLPVLCMSLFGCGIMAIVCLCCLFHFRLIIMMKIHDYNGMITNFLSGVRGSGDKFSKYLSKIASYMRGRYMLQALERKSIVSNEGIIMLTKHVEHLRAQMDIISNWLKDFERSPLPDMGEAGRSYIDFDFDIPPEKNRQYFLQLDNFTLTVHALGGEKISVPYPFVTGLEIKREWLYEENNILKKSRGEREKK